MRNRRFSRLIVAGLLGGFGSALLTTAAEADGPGWTTNSVIMRIVDRADGGFNVKLSPDVNGCNNNGGYGPNFAPAFASHLGLKNMKATLLSAFHAGTPISIYFSDSTCTIQEVILGGW